MIKEEKAGDISIKMFLCLLVGLGLWVVYGFLRNDLAIILTNSFSFLVNIAILTLNLWYKRNNKQ